MRCADARRAASIMISNSTRLWFVGGHVDWMMNTSLPRMFSLIFTNDSPSGKLVTVASPSGSGIDRQISSARGRLELPVKILSRESLMDGGDVGVAPVRRKTFLRQGVAPPAFRRGETAQAASAGVLLPGARAETGWQ